MKKMFLFFAVLFSANLFSLTPDEELLFRAARKNDVKTIEMLAKKGVNLNVREHEDDDEYSTKYTPLHKAISYNNKDALIALLELGANPNTRNGYGDTVLMTCASTAGKNNLSKIIIDDKKTDLNAKNKYGNTALRNAMSSQNYEIIKYLIEKGADIELISGTFGTALTYAVFENDIEMVKIIVEAGANVNARGNDGNTALHSTIWCSNYEIAKYLISKGADVNIKGGFGATPLIHAIISEQDVEMVKIFIEAGADVNTIFSGESPKYNGKSALQIAEELDNKEIINLLKKAGAK